MSLQRKIKRKRAYQNWKENMKGIPDKYKTPFCDYWKKVNIHS